MSSHQLFTGLSFTDKLIVVSLTLVVAGACAESLLGALLLVGYCCYPLPGLIRYLAQTAVLPAWDLPCREVK